MMSVLDKIYKFRDVKPFYEEEYLGSLFFGFVLAAAFTFFILMWVAVETDSDGFRYQKDSEWLEYFKEAQKQTDLSAVLLGNSRIRHAMRFGIDAGDIQELPDGRKLAVVQYSVNAAQFKDFQIIEADIINAKPDYLFIGREVLSNKRRESDRVVTYSRMVYRHFTERLGKKTPEDVWWEDRLDLVKCYDNYTRGMMKDRIVSTQKRDAHSLDPAINKNLEPLRLFIANARKAGIKVVILHIMPNLEILERYNVPVHLLDAYDIGHIPTNEELLPEQYDDVTWLSYQDDAGTSHYCDFVHIGEEGRPLFKKWFMQTVSEEL